MGTRTEIVYLCDLCGSDSQASTHTLTVDNHATEFEACPHCWQELLTHVARIDKVGRTPKRKQAKARTYPFPGESWKFTSHALIRMGERHLSPADVTAVAEQPEICRPGREPDVEIRVGLDVKVVVRPHTREILTAARREERLASAS